MSANTLCDWILRNTPEGEKTLYGRSIAEKVLEAMCCETKNKDSVAYLLCGETIVKTKISARVTVDSEHVFPPRFVFECRTLEINGRVPHNVSEMNAEVETTHEPPDKTEQMGVLKRLLIKCTLRGEFQLVNERYASAHIEFLQLRESLSLKRW